MPDCVTIYHNPQCSKSRETLALLQDRGVELRVIEYLKNAPTKAELVAILDKLGAKPGDIIRRKEKLFGELDLGDATGEALDDALLDAMVEHPILIERPIVVAGSRAALGRPPASVLEILETCANPSPEA